MCHSALAGTQNDVTIHDRDIISRLSAAESDAAAPWYISIFTTLVPTVATIFDPPLATPRESTLAQRTMSHTG